jgi:hypothetical protein
MNFCLYRHENLMWRRMSNIQFHITIVTLKTTTYFLCVIISKLRSGMYIFLLYSLTIAQWSKITELGYRCATTVSFKDF